MRIIRVKNNTESTKTWVNVEYSPGQIYQIPASQAVVDAHARNDIFLDAITHGEALIGDADTWLVGTSEQIAWLHGDCLDITSLPDPAPFAQPVYRTKRNATASTIEVAAGNTETIDFEMEEERYISGGTMIVKNAEFGDYISAEVRDIDGVIPEAYRSSLCENWPIVAKYIEKEFIEANSGDMTCHRVCTYPLNAKITPGLYLRVTYTAVNSGVTRLLAVNYNLTKKL